MAETKTDTATDAADTSGNDVNADTKTDDATTEKKPLGKDGTEFDPARAQHTIETLRAESKQREDESKALAAKLKEYEDANLSEKEKLEQAAQEKEREAADLATRLQEARMKLGIYAASAKLGCADPDLALAAIDRSKIKYDESGEPTNIEEELGALLEAKPILKGEPGKPIAPSLDAGAAARKAGPPVKLTEAELEQAEAMGGTEKFLAFKEARTIDEMLAVANRSKDSPQAGGSQKQ